MGNPARLLGARPVPHRLGCDSLTALLACLLCGATEVLFSSHAPKDHPSTSSEINLALSSLKQLTPPLENRI